MKKNLKISELKLKSFVTETEAKNIVGGATGNAKTCQLMDTMFSCLQYISCDPRDCAADPA